MSRHAPLAVDGDLLLTADGQSVRVTASGTVITVTLPRLWSRQWVTGPLTDRSQRQAFLAGLQRALQAAGLTLQFEVRRQVVARLGPLSRPSLLSRLLRLGAVEVRLVRCLRALFGPPYRISNR